MGVTKLESLRGGADPGTPRARLRILLVDDDHDVLRLLRHFLRHHDIIVADAAEAAMGMLAAEVVDVIVSDNDMGAVSGLVLLAHTWRHHPGVRRILFSGATRLQPDDLDNLCRAGIIDWIVAKPNFLEVVRLCEQLAEGERAA